MKKPFDISELQFIKRYVIGNNDPNNIKSEQQIQNDLDLMNSDLNKNKGRIVGSERNFMALQIGEHLSVIQYTVYHLGFCRKW